MGRREQEMIDQMRQWRAEIDARPEPAAPDAPQASMRRESPPREQRLAEARARRKARLAAPVPMREVSFFKQHGIMLVQGPAAILEVAWQSGQPVCARGFDGAYYPVKLASVTKADRSGMCIGHPAGSLADRNRVVRVARRGRPPKTDAQQPRSVRRRGGTRRASRER